MWIIIVGDNMKMDSDLSIDGSDGFEKYVERLLNPLGLSTGIFEDRRVTNGKMTSVDSFIQNAKGVKKDDIRRFFFQNPDYLNKTLSLLEPEDRRDFCKILWNITNEDIRVNFENFGVPPTNTRVDRALGYGKNSNENTLDTLYLQVIVSVLIELPLIFYCTKPSNTFGLQEQLNEYYLLKTQIVGVGDLKTIILQSVENSSETLRLNKRCKKVIKPFILRRNNQDIFLNMHIYPDFYELRLGNPLSEFINFSEVLKSITSLKPTFYYYAPSILCREKFKVCIVGSTKLQEASLQRYKKQIEVLTSVFTIEEK